MNTMHLKYAVEVARTGSISGAAENLYMNQPQLSKAIRDLENYVGVPLFSRTSKGVIPTTKGEQFLMYAHSILDKIDAIENLHKPETTDVIRLDASAPRASYIADAFYKYVTTLDGNLGIKISYNETDSRRVIKNVASGESNIGIIRFNERYEKYYMQFAEEKDVIVSPLYEFYCKALVSKNHPLANKGKIRIEDIKCKYIKIMYGDMYIPMLSVSKLNEIISDYEDKNSIMVFDRHSQYTLLSGRNDCYAMSSNVTQTELDRFSLVQLEVENGDLYKDLFVYRRNYTLTDMDKKFMEAVKLAAK